MADLDNIIQSIYDTMPHGRAWRGKNHYPFVRMLAQSQLDFLNFISVVFSLNSNFLLYYDQWKTILNLAHSTTDEGKIKDIEQAFTDTGGQSVEYVESELRKAGFNVRVSTNFNPTIDPALYLINRTDYRLGVDKARVGEARFEEDSPFEIVMNKLDQKRDEQYITAEFISILEKRWTFAFFIHGENGILDKATIEKSRQQSLRLLLLKIKNHGTVAFMNVRYI